MCLWPARALQQLILIPVLERILNYSGWGSSAFFWRKTFNLQSCAVFRSGFWTPIGVYLVWVYVVYIQFPSPFSLPRNWFYISAVRLMRAALAILFPPWSFHFSFLKKNIQTLLLSKQFVQWNEILTQLEAASEVKPTAEWWQSWEGKEPRSYDPAGLELLRRDCSSCLHPLASPSLYSPWVCYKWWHRLLGAPWLCGP